MISLGTRQEELERKKEKKESGDYLCSDVVRDLRKIVSKNLMPLKANKAQTSAAARTK